MKNLIAINKTVYAHANYVLRGEPDKAYYVGIEKARIDALIQQYGQGFSIIIYGDTDDPSDFYVIPFSIATTLFRSEHLRQADARPRWKTFVVNDELTVTGCPTRVRVAERYGNLGLVDDNPVELAEDEEGGLPVATEADTEVLRQAKHRRGHEAWSKRVLENFNSQCCLSGVSERDLLVASHIVPWGKRVPTRLDEANGLWPL